MSTFSQLFLNDWKQRGIMPKCCSKCSQQRLEEARSQFDDDGAEWKNAAAHDPSSIHPLISAPSLLLANLSLQSVCPNSSCLSCRAASSTFEYRELLAQDGLLDEAENSGESNKIKMLLMKQVGREKLHSPSNSSKCSPLMCHSAAVDCSLNGLIALYERLEWPRCPSLTSLDSLITRFNNVHTLTIHDSSLRCLSYLPPCLKVLDVSRNRHLRELKQLPVTLLSLTAKHCALTNFQLTSNNQSLIRVDIEGNNLESLSSVDLSVARYPSLRYVFVSGNPVCLHPHYRGWLLQSNPNIITLDGVEASRDIEEERARAQAAAQQQRELEAALQESARKPQHAKNTGRTSKMNHRTALQQQQAEREQHTEPEVVPPPVTIPLHFDVNSLVSFHLSFDRLLGVLDPCSLEAPPEPKKKSTASKSARKTKEQENQDAPDGWTMIETQSQTMNAQGDQLLLNSVCYKRCLFYFELRLPVGSTVLNEPGDNNVSREISGFPLPTTSCPSSQPPPANVYRSPFFTAAAAPTLAHTLSLNSHTSAQLYEWIQHAPDIQLWQRDDERTRIESNTVSLGIREDVESSELKDKDKKAAKPSRASLKKKKIPDALPPPTYTTTATEHDRLLGTVKLDLSWLLHPRSTRLFSTTHPVTLSFGSLCAHLSGWYSAHEVRLPAMPAQAREALIARAINAGLRIDPAIHQPDVSQSNQAVTNSTPASPATTKAAKGNKTPSKKEKERVEKEKQELKEQLKNPSYTLDCNVYWNTIPPAPPVTLAAPPTTLKNAKSPRAKKASNKESGRTSATPSSPRAATRQDNN